jgi:hypothetical protein
LLGELRGWLSCLGDWEAPIWDACVAAGCGTSTEGPESDMEMPGNSVEDVMKVDENGRKRAKTTRKGGHCTSAAQTGVLRDAQCAMRNG